MVFCFWSLLDHSCGPEPNPCPAEPGLRWAGFFIRHTGAEGRIVSTRGALSFRLGDLFAGLDKEVMRLGEDGNVSIKGTLKAGKGIEFSDGTVQTTGLSGRKDKDGNIIGLIQN